MPASCNFTCCATRRTRKTSSTPHSPPSASSAPSVSTFVGTLAWLRSGLRRQRLGAVRYATRLKQGGGGGGGWQLADLCGGRSRKKAEAAKINSYVRRRSQELDETASMAC